MELKDLIVAPLFLVVIYFLAYVFRAKFTDFHTRRYFIPGLTLKIIGALAVGFIYQFYYSGGDTFNYFTHGSRYIWEAFLDSPLKAFQLIFADGTYQEGTARDQPSYFVVRVAGFFDIFTFHTYSATAIFFALFSFSGLWGLFYSFYRLYPKLHKQLAISIFFIPSVFFWGSGILKDTLTLGALGWATYSIVNIFFLDRKKLLSICTLLLSCFIIYSIKIYILLCFLPAVIIWLFLSNLRRIRSKLARIMISPFILALAVFLSYAAVLKVGEESKRYSLETLAYTAEASARWLAYVSEVEGGSGYTLGDFDYSTRGIIKKIFPAIWVSMFRPYLWEVKNPVMLLASLESLALLFFTFYVIFKKGVLNVLKNISARPAVLFCLVFSIAFACAIGFSTYNFGSLVRYKIPFVPFYLIGLFIIHQPSVHARAKVRSNGMLRVK
jgi:hypothetical protein